MQKKLPTSCCMRSDYDQDFNSLTDDRIVNIAACQNMTSDYHNSVGVFNIITRCHDVIGVGLF